MTRVLFNISLYDDDVVEDKENFNLIIDTSSLPNGIITDNPSRAIMIIRNDDSKFVEYIHTCS